MQESLLHFIWRYQYFDKTGLLTTTGTPVNIINPGLLNTDAGPDFLGAKVMIEGIEWNGNAEIHIKSSDWHSHKHTTDPAYHNVILHIVWDDDKVIYYPDHSAIPTIVLKGRVDTKLIQEYRQLLNSPETIPCTNSIAEIQSIVKLSMVEKTVVSRLKQKADDILAIHQANNSNWEETAYQLLAKNFGFKVNSEIFFRLSQVLPLKVLAKYANNLCQVEALLFGMAGFLEVGAGDEYNKQLKKEFSFLSHKHNLAEKNLLVHQWKFLRLRPSNFPTLRIAQFATFISQQTHFFSTFMEVKDINLFYKLFAQPTSAYWHYHYQFGKEAKKKVPELGKSSIENVLINTVAPLLVAYGIAVADQNYTDRAIGLLQTLKPEDNKITRVWKREQVVMDSAFDSQGLISLYNDFCMKKRCLHCDIGVSILKKG